MGDVLVFAEYLHEHFPKSTLVAINAGFEMARKRSVQCVVAVLGENVDALAQTAAKYGAAKVIALEHPALKNYLADAYAQALANLVKASCRIRDGDGHGARQGFAAAPGGAHGRSDGVGHHHDQ